MQTVRYYYEESGASEPRGPVSLPELHALAAKGQVRENTQVIREGDDRWIQFQRLGETETDNESGKALILHPDWKPPPLEFSASHKADDVEDESSSLGSLLFPIIVTALAILAVVAAVNWRKLSREVGRTVTRPVDRSAAPVVAPRIAPAPQIQPTAAPTPSIAEALTIAPSVAPSESPPPSRPAPPEPWLGVWVQSLNANPRYKEVFNGIEKGVVVQMVEPASAASESELWNGDVITHFDGVVVSSEDDAQHEMLKRKPGDTIELTVLRKNRVLKIPVRLSERPRSFAGIWEGTDHQFKFGDQAGNSDYKQADSSALRVEVSDDESQVTAGDPSRPPMQRTTIPNDRWYHQDSRTLAWVNDPQYQITLLGDGSSAVLKRTPYKDQIDSSPQLKSFLTTSRALLRKGSGHASVSTSQIVSGKSQGAPKVEASLSSNQTVIGELVLLRVTLSGTAQFSMPEQITADGLEIQPCGIASGQIDPSADSASGIVYEYAILPLKTGRFTIPPQTISTQNQDFETAGLELSVRSGRPELPTFGQWLNRDAFGNLLPPRKNANGPKHESAPEPMVYKRRGPQKLTRATVAAYGFSVGLPVDVFPNAVEHLRQSNILMPPKTASPSVTYLPPRPASSFDATYTKLIADASPSDPNKVVHDRGRKENSFVVQFAEGDHGEYIAGFRKGNSMYLMDVWYNEQNCPFTADSLKAMADSFLANGPR